MYLLSIEFDHKTASSKLYIVRACVRACVHACVRESLCLCIWWNVSRLNCWPFCWHLLTLRPEIKDLIRFDLIMSSFSICSGTHTIVGANSHSHPFISSIPTPKHS